MDQVYLLTAPLSALGGTMRDSVANAVASGAIPPEKLASKSVAAQIRERLEAEKAAAALAKEQPQRRRRRKRG